MIADSSPLILLARADRLRLLENLFDEVEIAPAVETETVERAAGLPDARRIEDAIDTGWIQVTEVQTETFERIDGRYPNLGPGEQATIALALDREAHAVLVDDASSRQAAQLEGVRPVGCLGVLARAHHREVLESKAALQAAVLDLLDAGLWVSADVIEAFWAGLGGRP